MDAPLRTLLEPAPRRPRSPAQGRGPRHGAEAEDTDPPMPEETMSTATQVPVDDYGVVTAPDTVRIERLLPGPIQRVWDYLTESELRGKWFASGELDARVGG